MAIEGEAGGTGAVSDTTGTRKRTFPEFSGTNNSKSAEAMAKSVSKESFQWGFAAGMHSGLTYGLTEVRGTHDWKNSVVAGALTSERASHEQIVKCAITGATLSAAANAPPEYFIL